MINPAITADVSCRLLEVDYSGIEAKILGWQLRHFDPEGAPKYIRLATLGVHSAVTVLAINQPLDLARSDADLAGYFKEIKAQYPYEYDCCKRNVHGNNYGLTIHGMVERFPHLYPDLKTAERFQHYYHTLAPGIPIFHTEVRKRAKDVGYLGGPQLPGEPPSIWAHPYGYRHWFWDVLTTKPCDEATARKWMQHHQLRSRIVWMHGRPFKVVFGGDSNRVIAFYPQSTAAGRLKEAELRLFLPDSPDYIGDAYFGRTPLLGPIHDSLLLHIPVRIFDRVVEIVARVMQEPSRHLPCPPEWGLGAYLPIGISGKAGRNWAPAVDDRDVEKAHLKGYVLRSNRTGMDDIDLPTIVPSAGADDPVIPRDEEDQEDWSMLERKIA